MFVTSTCSALLALVNAAECISPDLEPTSHVMYRTIKAGVLKCDQSWHLASLRVALLDGQVCVADNAAHSLDTNVRIYYVVYS